MTTIPVIVQAVLNDLHQEKSLGPVQGISDLLARQQRRQHLLNQIQQLEKEAQSLRSQARNLPTLPPLKSIQWAQSVRAMPNLMFLEVDTTGLHEDAEIIRLVLLNIHGQTLFDCLAIPSQPLSKSLVTITGLTNAEIQAAGIPIVEALSKLCKVMQGAYVLSYNLDFDLGKLREATQRHQLSEITLIGEDLMARAMSYFHQSSYPKLEGLCKQIGQPLPSQPHQTALDRARGQIAVLNAIADMFVSLPSAPTPQDTPAEDEDTDDHPF
ncbi:hypothetical protein KDW_17580 [Dictyobacter vulcani]|uniref:Exonuclease domain-containing protein n=1 Tax=Dictyobacter vulcani TaxID=2607529 RepID=A0A5J4KQW0_9CHLR|nr:hypothetical protein [Dictyobacter vulcani]GER87596.1 hypothetical protein KDW_17580 [Dictyobacter vulcani]